MALVIVLFEFVMGWGGYILQRESRHQMGRT